MLERGASYADEHTEVSVFSAIAKEDLHMSRIAAALALACSASLVMPACAFAADGSTGSALRIGLSLIGLSVAVVLLVTALLVRRVAFGGVIAERISYVILAIVCLAASAVAQWTQNFVAGVTLEQVRMASEVLVIVAMALLAVYFYSVYSAMKGYLESMTGSEKLRSEQEADERA